MKSRTFNRVAGVILGLTGLMAMGIGTYMSAQAIKHVAKEAPATYIPATQQECVTHMNAFGFAPQALPGGVLKVEKIGVPVLENAHESLMSSSLAILGCPGYQLRSFCLGEKCAPAGMSFELSPGTAGRR